MPLDNLLFSSSLSKNSMKALTLSLLRQSILILCWVEWLDEKSLESTLQRVSQILSYDKLSYCTSCQSSIWLLFSISTKLLLPYNSYFLTKHYKLTTVNLFNFSVKSRLKFILRTLLFESTTKSWTSESTVYCQTAPTEPIDETVVTHSFNIDNYQENISLLERS